MPDTCAACGNVFGSTSKPRWAFMQDGRFVGRVHTSCRWLGAEQLITRDQRRSAEEAHFEVWLMYFHERPEQGTPAWEAFVLADGPSETLTPSQDDFLTEDVRLGGKTVGRVLEIVAAHTALIREYRRWRASLEPAPDGCALATGT